MGQHLESQVEGGTEVEGADTVGVCALCPLSFAD